MPALGFSLFLLALGAIFAFAVEVELPGISINAVGVILMLIGLVGVVLSMLQWTSYSPWGGSSSGVREERVRRTRVADPYRRDDTRLDDTHDEEVVERRVVHRQDL